jgi:hypothetical protein
LHANKDAWYLKAFAFVMKIVVPLLSVSVFAVIAMFILTNLAPNQKRGGIFMLLTIGPLIFISWILGWNQLGKTDIVFDTELLIIFIAFSLGTESKKQTQS